MLFIFFTHFLRLMRSTAGQYRPLISIFKSLITPILLIISLEIGEISIFCCVCEGDKLSRILLFVFSKFVPS